VGAAALRTPPRFERRRVSCIAASTLALPACCSAPRAGTLRRRAGPQRRSPPGSTAFVTLVSPPRRNHCKRSNQSREFFVVRPAFDDP